MHNSLFYLEGKVVKVWFSTEISEDGNHSVGHTKGYVKVLVPLDQSLPGLVKFVKVHMSKRLHIEGEVSASVEDETLSSLSLRTFVPYQSFSVFLVTAALAAGLLVLVRSRK